MNTKTFIDRFIHLFALTHSLPSLIATLNWHCRSVGGHLGHFQGHSEPARARAHARARFGMIVPS